MHEYATTSNSSFDDPLIQYISFFQACFSYTNLCSKGIHSRKAYCLRGSPATPKDHIIKMTPLAGGFLLGALL